MNKKTSAEWYYGRTYAADSDRYQRAPESGEVLRPMARDDRTE